MPVAYTYRCVYIIKHVRNEWKFENLFFYTLDISIDLNSLDKLKKVSNNFFIWQLREIGTYGLVSYFLIW